MAIEDYASVTIPTSSLPGVRLVQLAAELDCSIAIPGSLPQSTLTGYVEWAGHWQDRCVSVGWDWALAPTSSCPYHAGNRRSTLVVLNPQEIRTNIVLISDSGVRHSTGVTRTLLYPWIETLDWRNALEPLLSEWAMNLL